MTKSNDPVIFSQILYRLNPWNPLSSIIVQSHALSQALHSKSKDRRNVSEFLILAWLYNIQ